MRFLIPSNKTRALVASDCVLRFGIEVISGNYAEEKSYRLSPCDRLGLRR